MISREAPHPDACPLASLQRSCLMMSEGEKGVRREENRIGEQRLSISRATFREGAGTRSRHESADRAFPAAEGASGGRFEAETGRRHAPATPMVLCLRARGHK